MRRVAATTIAGSFAMAAFAVAIIAGLASGNPAASVMQRAVLAMVICYPVGLAVGAVAQRLVQEYIEAHKSAHPDADGEGHDDFEGGSDEISTAVGTEAEDEEVLVV